MADSFREKLVKVAREQLAEFGGLDESNPKLRRQIQRYWEETGFAFPGEETPWSAVFISWCVKQAGATKTQFKFAPSHSTYVKRAIRNADTGTGVFRALPIDKARVEVGDLIHVNRDNGRKTYQEARSEEGYNSHCDIVVNIRPGVAEVIGGNLRNTRALETVTLTTEGFVKQRSKEPYICVIKHIGPGGGVEEDDLMATVIKVKDPQDHQLWLYAAGQRRPLKSPPEIEELRKAGLLDNRPTIELSRTAFDAIPIMPGAE
jgi:hypothetical protein